MFYKTFFIIVAVNNLLCHALSEGDPCTWGEFNGTCLDVHHCYSFIFDKQDKRHPPICSFRGSVPIICCTECPELHVTDTSNALYDKKYGVIWKTGHKLVDVCLENIHRATNLLKLQTKKYYKSWDKTRKCHVIERRYQFGSVGGVDTRKGQYPYMALLGYGETLDSAEWLCGGTIISDRFILTAGHCIFSPRIGPVKYIALGVWKRSDDMTLWQKHNVKNIIPHPEYHSPSKYHDIALLETEDKIEFTFGTSPACLQTNKIKTPSQIFALGWGTLGSGKHLADILQKVTLEKFTDTECASTYGPHRFMKHGFNSSTQMCFGHHEVPRDTCEGDSGGPLVHKSAAPFQRDLIIGVTSYGVHCGKPGAGIYTKLEYYLPWIEKFVWPN